MRAAIFIAIAMVLAGCFSARKGADKSLDRVQKADEAGASNRVAQIEKAAALVHGTGRALAAETNRSPAVSLAYDLNSRAETVLGAPRYQDAVAMENIVRGALSPLVDEQRASREALARIDGQVASLQRRMDSIQREKGKAEDARDDKLTEYASEADTLRRIKRWLWFGGLSLAALFVAPFICQVASVAFPAFAPLTQLFSSIVTLPGRLLVKAVPAARTSLGVVEEEAHERVSTAALQVTAAIEEWKKRDRASFDQHLAPILRDKTDESARDTITIMRKGKRKL